MKNKVLQIVCDSNSGCGDWNSAIFCTATFFWNGSIYVFNERMEFILGCICKGLLIKSRNICDLNVNNWIYLFT